MTTTENISNSHKIMKKYEKNTLWQHKKTTWRSKLIRFFIADDLNLVLCDSAIAIP